MEMSETEKAYLAGFFDGEGSISCHFNASGCIQLQMSLVNSYDAPLIRLHELFGGSLFQCKRGPTGRKTLWRWTVVGKACQLPLETLLPYLQLKKRRAEYGLGLLSLNGLPGQHADDSTTTKKMLLVTGITALNHAGELSDDDWAAHKLANADKRVLPQ